MCCFRDFLSHIRDNDFFYFSVKVYFTVDSWKINVIFSRKLDMCGEKTFFFNKTWQTAKLRNVVGRVFLLLCVFSLWLFWARKNVIFDWKRDIPPSYKCVTHPEFFCLFIFIKKCVLLSSIRNDPCTIIRLLTAATMCYGKRMAR